MILIRGIKGESYARRIEKGLVDCRDILSALLEPPVTGYEYSDYYEKNMVKALSFFWPDPDTHLHNPHFLYSLLIDHYIPHIYLTYFHILNERSLEWLDKFEDDYLFIALNIKIDRITQTAIGNEYFGSKMAYVDSIRQLEQSGFKNFQAACMCSIENLFKNKRDMAIPLKIYNTLAFALLCREQDEKFTDLENEFRIIAYDCPRIEGNIVKQIPRNAVIRGKSGIKYTGVLNAGVNTLFKSNMYTLRNPVRLLRDILFEERGDITLDSQFKAIQIHDVSDDYRYIGDKEACSDFIRKMLLSPPKDIFVEQTMRKEYPLDKRFHFAFTKGSYEVKY